MDTGQSKRVGNQGEPAFRQAGKREDTVSQIVRRIWAVQEAAESRGGRYFDS